ncbi:MAG: T9SS type A sorting domain-containing protein [Bacteroidota bacterium]
MKNLCTLLLFVILASIAKGQIITTIAGNGGGGYNGDGGPAQSAQLQGASKIAFDNLGTMYIADRYNNRVRKISNGIISTIIGNGTFGFSGDNGPAIDAQINPTAIAVDISGNLFIADYSNRIRKVTASNGIITTIAGNGVQGYNCDNILSTNAEIAWPESIVVDNSGNVYFSDAGNYRIRKIDHVTGIITTIAGTGTQGYNGDSILATNAEIFPYGIALDNAGNVFIAEPMNKRVRKVDAITGMITTVAGAGAAGLNVDGIQATTAYLSFPCDVAIGNNGSLYIADNMDGKIRLVDNLGIIHTVAGNGLIGYSGDYGNAINAAVSEPSALALDPCHNLYISCQNNSHIRKVWLTTTNVPLVNVVAIPNGTICAGTVVTFSATPINAGVAPTYQWVKNGLIVAGATNSTYTYTPATGDSIQCLIKSSVSCAGTALSSAIHMIVTPLITPTISIAATPDNAVCIGTPVTYTATITNGNIPIVYQWKKNGLSVGSNNNTYTFTPNNSDSISCILTTNTACASINTVSSNTIHMIVGSSLVPSINISAYPNNTVCLGTAVTYNAIISAGGGSPVYHWYKNGIAVGTNSSSFTYTPANGDSVRCFFSSTAACASPLTANSNTIYMAVIPIVMPNITIAISPNDTVCVGTTVTYTATTINGGNAPVYHWIKNGTLTGSNSGTYTYVPTGGDSVSCILASTAACPSAATVSSNTIHTTVFARTSPYIDITVSPNDTLCIGSIAIFSVTSYSGGAIPGFQWKKNGINIGPGISSLTYFPANGDNVICELHTNAECLNTNIVSSNIINMTVKPNIIPIVTISGDTIVTLNTTVTYTSTVNVTDSVAYVWMVNGGYVGPNCNGNTYTYMPLNGDVVTCVITMPPGCYTASDTVSNALTIHVTSGITQLSTSVIHIYPNPATSILNIDGLLENVSYRIMNLVGVTMQEGTLHVGTHNISTQALAAGIYLLELTDTKGMREVVRVVRE